MRWLRPTLRRPTGADRRGPRHRRGARRERGAGAHRPLEPLLVAVDADAGADAYHLRRELYAQVQSNPAIFDSPAGRFCLDGLWVLGPRNGPNTVDEPNDFWRVLGHDPATKQHPGCQWRDLIFPDLALAIDNFCRHCADVRHPHDQIRYRHAGRFDGLGARRGIADPRRCWLAAAHAQGHTDVTGIMRAEEARSAAVALRREGERRLRELADSLPQLVWTCCPDGWWCDFLSRRWSNTPASLSARLSRQLARTVHPDDHESGWWRRGRRRSPKFTISFSNSHPPRRRRRLALVRHARAAAARCAGPHRALVGTNTDAAGHARDRRALRASEARFRALLDQAADAIYVHDADGRPAREPPRLRTLGLPRFVRRC